MTDRNWFRSSGFVIRQVPAATLAGWTVGRRDAALLALREQLFGAQMAVLADCPGCNETLEMEFPVSAIMHGVGLNITVMSHCGRLHFGIVADRDLVDDPWPLAASLATAQDELLALVPAPVPVA